MECNIENWKEIPFSNGLYFVSDLGRVRGPRRIVCPYNNGKGYLQVKLCINGVRKNYRVHQLVALCFIDNPNGYTEIHHINEIKSDNRVQNLEWCNRVYNIAHSPICKENARKLGLSKRIPVIIDNVHYSSITEAMTLTGKTYKSIKNTIMKE